MINIIGLGDVGCRIADQFANHDNYDVYKIGIGMPKNKRERGVVREKSPEKYEKNCPAMKHFLRDLEGNTILIVNGGEQISATVLRVLEYSRPGDTTVVYIQPDLSSLNGETKRNENVVFNVLQEYARSGAIAKVLLFHLPRVEKAMGEVPIIGYEDALYNYIVSSLNLINYFEHSEAVLSVDSEPIEHSRIMTISMISLEDTDEKTFFDLDHVGERMYYCGINENELRNDNQLLNKLKEIIDLQREGDQRTSYRVYATTYEEPHIFCVKSSAVIQTADQSA